MKLNGKEKAEAVVEKLLQTDACSANLGLQVIDLDARHAVVSLTVGETMVNGHGVCHGGMIFTLADTCCAFASNSENESALLSSAQIELLRPAHLGDELTATATAVNQGRRKGIYDVRVVNQNGELIAVFRGQTQRLGESLVHISAA
ncbi:MAG: phenylacetic acid degradation protein PaaD [Gammaproteobacteria bacterium]|nr:phenylacetic acid degradation protein PaaD [Gammaproteobacteria bacterium]